MAYDTWITCLVGSSVWVNKWISEWMSTLAHLWHIPAWERKEIKIISKYQKDNKINRHAEWRSWELRKSQHPSALSAQHSPWHWPGKAPTVFFSIFLWLQAMILTPSGVKITACSHKKMEGMQHASDFLDDGRMRFWWDFEMSTSNVLAGPSRKQVKQVNLVWLLFIRLVAHLWIRSVKRRA